MASNPLAPLFPSTGVDLLSRIAKVESSGNPAALGPPIERMGGLQARGKYQFLPETAREVAEELGVDFDESRLTEDEEYQDLLAKGLASKLSAKYGGNEVLVAAAWNAGPGRVDEWLSTIGDPRSGTISDAEFGAKIPFPETRNYVAKVANARIRPQGTGFGEVSYDQLKSFMLTGRIQAEPTIVAPEERTDPSLLEKFGGDVMRGARRALMPLAGAFGEDTEVSREGRPITEAQKLLEIQLDDGTQQEFTTFRQVDTFAKGAKFVLEAFGENVANLLFIAAPAGLSYRAAQALGATAKGAKGAAYGGGFLADLGLQAGETAEHLKAEGLDPTAATVLPAATAKAALDFFSVLKIAERLGLKKAVVDTAEEVAKSMGLWHRVGRGASILPIEGSTETLQTFIDQFNGRFLNHKDVLERNPDELNELLETFVRATAGAAPIGIAGMIVPPQVEQREATEEEHKQAFETDLRTQLTRLNERIKATEAEIEAAAFPVAEEAESTNLPSLRSVLQEPYFRGGFSTLEKQEFARSLLVKGVRNTPTKTLGDFDDAGENGYVTTTDPAKDQVLRAAAQVLGEWQAALGLKRHFVVADIATTDPIMVRLDPRRTTQGTVGGRFGNISDKLSMIEVNLAHFGKPGARKKGEFFTVLAHEFGHGVMFNALEDATPGVKRALLNEYRQWLQGITSDEKGSFHKAYGAVFDPSKTFFGKLGDNTNTPRFASAKDWLRVIHNTRPNEFSYRLSFNEYFAQKFARYASKNEAFRELVVKNPEAASFWGKLVRVLKRFHARFANAYGLPTTFEKWVETLRMRQEAKALAEQLGVDPVEPAKPAETVRDTPGFTPNKGREVFATSELSHMLNRIGTDPVVVDGLESHAQNHLSWWKFFGREGLLRGLTPLQVVERFNLPWAKRYMDFVDKFSQTKMSLIEGADNVTQEWLQLGPKNAERLSEFLFRVSTESDEHGRRLLESEILKLRQELHVDDKSFVLWQKVDAYFQTILGKIENGIMLDMVRQYYRGDAKALLAQWRAAPGEKVGILDAANVTNSAALDFELRNAALRFQSLRNRNFFPRSRFGKFTLRLIAKEDVTWDGKTFRKGKTIEFRTYESLKERNKDLEIMRKEVGGMPIRLVDDILSDTEFSFVGMPQVLIKQLVSQLNKNPQTALTKVQMELLDDLSIEMSPGRTFLRHLKRRKGIAGFSEDAMRTFAAYSFSAANHLARVEHGREMGDTIKEAGDSISQMESRTEQRQFLHYFQRHFDYMMSPGNDWAQLRSLGFLWYLGFNVKSALVNLSQVPMVTYPVLAGQYGDAKATRELAKAMKDIRFSITNAQWSRRGKALEPQVREVFQRLAEEGLIDESMVMELAGLAEGSTLAKVMPTSGFNRAINRASFYGGFLFRTAEKYNRRVTALAAFRLEMEKTGGKLVSDPTGGMMWDGGDKESAYISAKEAIRKSQFEYAKWNRPEFMRGKKSVIFLFWNFMQHIAYLATGQAFRGDPLARAQAVRFWMMALLVGGLQGLPFAENILSIVDFFGTNARKLLGHANPRVAVREELREVLSELEWLMPIDGMTSGLSRYYGLGPLHFLSTFGAPIPNVDVSGSLSMGNIVPWVGDGYGSRDDPDAQFVNATMNILGPVGNIPYQMWRAMTSQDPNTWKNVERVLPTALKNLNRAARYATDHRESLRDGTEVIAFDPHDAEHMSEIFAQGAGFTPTRKAQRSDLVATQKEVVGYYSLRRQILMEQYFAAVDAEDKDWRETILTKVREYNDSIKGSPLASVQITRKDLEKSVKTRQRNRAKRMADIPLQTRFTPAMEAIASTFPEAERE